MNRKALVATAVGLLMAACTDETVRAAPVRTEPVQAAATGQSPPGGLPPEASCRHTRLRNPLFGIFEAAGSARPADAITDEIAGAGTPAIWAWRSASTEAPRWAAIEVPSALYLGEGQAVSQAGLSLPAGAWRLVVLAGPAGETPAGLRIEFEGDPGGPFEIESLSPSTLNLTDVELPAGVDRLILTGLGPGEARLTMACLSPLQ